MRRRIVRRAHCIASTARLERVVGAAAGRSSRAATATRSEGPDTNRVAQLALPSSLALAAFGAQAEGFAPSAGGPYTGPAAQVSDAAAGAQTASPQAATRLLPIEVRAITPAA